MAEHTGLIERHGRTRCVIAGHHEHENPCVTETHNTASSAALAYLIDRLALESRDGQVGDTIDCDFDDDLLARRCVDPGEVTLDPRSRRTSGIPSTGRHGHGRRPDAFPSGGLLACWSDGA